MEKSYLYVSLWSLLTISNFSPQGPTTQLFSLSSRRDKKNKETTDPNLNDLEINDNSSKDNIIIITRIDCNNGILENNNEFNIPLEILVNDNKETLTKNNCE